MRPQRLPDGDGAGAGRGRRSAARLLPPPGRARRRRAGARAPPSSPSSRRARRFPTELAPNHYRFPIQGGSVYRAASPRVLALLEEELGGRDVHVHFGWPTSSWLDRMATGVFVANLMRLPPLFPQLRFAIEHAARRSGRSPSRRAKRSAWQGVRCLDPSQKVDGEPRHLVALDVLGDHVPAALEHVRLDRRASRDGGGAARGSDSGALVIVRGRGAAAPAA